VEKKIKRRREYREAWLVDEDRYFVVPGENIDALESASA
jgi:hypothetical protein